MPFTYPSDFRPFRTGLVATPGGVQANGVPLAYGTNVITVCASLGDSALLPVSNGSCRIIVVANYGAAQAFVYPDVGGQIDLLGVNGARSVGSGITKLFVDTGVGKWFTLQGA
jgi:hypothetical protein